MPRTNRSTLFAACTLAAALSPIYAQPPKPVPPPAIPPAPASIDQPDARRVRDDFSKLLNHYTPTLRNAISTDPTLLANQSYLAPYPQVAAYLAAHPEVQRDPAYYVGTSFRPFREDNTPPAERVWSRAMEQLGILAGFGMAIGLLIWLIRTLIDYRRWNRLTKIQTDVHTKILDRVAGNEELLEYMKSPAGAKFLESSPIALDAAPRALSAPLGRILWSVQAGVVLIAGGVGLQVVAAQVSSEVVQPIRALGLLGLFLGIGFIVSAGVSYFISGRLGLLDRAVPTAPPRSETQIG